MSNPFSFPRQLRAMSRLPSKLFLAILVLATALCGCPKQQAQQETTVAGNGCEVLFQSVDPAIAPLCVSVAQLLVAIEAVLPANDAGILFGAPLNVGPAGQFSRALTPAERSQVYAYLATLKMQDAIRKAH